MKKAILITIATVMLAAPMAQAQQSYRHDDRAPGQHRVTKEIHKTEIHKKVVIKKRWRKGERMNDWQRRAAIRDYKRYGLRQPGRDQRWVKVDNDYVLISVASGLIAGIIAAR
ncbi:RcnB family protein [Rhizobium sp. 18065]|uniref:RcnB family protein n=1 Tax=Rhizobium sp. 18065 TaxID=2681411 RepID=UPI001358C118|nr:RcnB family protein [Rhizobium sp. 18065]